MAREKIEFPFTVAKTQTLADGAPRITIDLPESCIMEMAMLAQANLDGIRLKAIVIVDDDTGNSKKIHF